MFAPRLFAGSCSSSLAGRFLPLCLRRRIRGGFLTIGIEQVGDLLLFNLGLTVVVPASGETVVGVLGLQPELLLKVLIGVL